MCLKLRFKKRHQYEKHLISDRMGVFDMLDIVRENSWKAGIEQKERMKEKRLEKVR